MRRPRWISLLAVVMSLAMASTALATHAPGGATITDIARGTLTGRLNYNFAGVEIETSGPRDIVNIEVTFSKGGGSAGWHHHPGPVFVIVRSGTISVWDEHCIKRTYTAGTTFFERGPRHSMLVKNEDPNVDAMVSGTFIVAVGATPLTLTDPHVCGVEG